MSLTVVAGTRAPVRRVALTATACVAVAYLIISVVVLIVVNSRLTGDVDQRLVTSLARLGGASTSPSPDLIEPVGDAPRFGPPLVIWILGADGSISSPNTNVILPAQYRAINSPQTVSIQGVDVRLAGSALDGGRIVVGQTMDSVSRTQSSLMLSELAIAPVLLGVVFIGALAIGNRVAAPIESARRRQMDFTADASHEFRTPLAVIEAQTSLALGKDHPKAWYAEAFSRVDTEARRMRRLVDDMLWLARFDATAPPGAELIDVGILARQAADRFATVAQTRGIALSVRADSGMVIIAPPDWLDRLAGVLLDNACRYTPAGGSVAVVVSVVANRVRLAIDDSGPGIPDEERTRIFDRFHRATNATSGTGLGLAIADAVVRGTAGRWEIGRSSDGGASMAVSWARAGMPPS